MKSIRSQLFRLADHGNRMTKIVQRFHAVYIYAHTLLAQKSGQFGVSTPALMTGHIKGHHTHFAESLQRFINRRTVLI